MALLNLPIIPVQNIVKSVAKTAKLKINNFAEKYKSFWNTPIQIQYAYSPYDIVGNSGKPHETTQKLGTVAQEVAGATAIPLLAASAATVGPVATIAGLGTGIVGSIAGGYAGLKIAEGARLNEEALEMFNDAGSILGGFYGGVKGTKFTKNYYDLLSKGYSESAAEAITQTTSLPMIQTPISKPGINGKSWWKHMPKAKITEAERVGIPKGIDRDIANSSVEILENAKAFAEKYGYDIPTTIEEAKSMYKRHNTFARSVFLPETYEELISKGFSPESAKLFANDHRYPDWFRMMPKEDQVRYLSTHGYSNAYRGSWKPGLEIKFEDDFVFVTPNIGEGSYAEEIGLENTGLVRRPFSFRDPRNWHKSADFEFTPKHDTYGAKAGQVFQGNNITNEVKLAIPHLISEGIAYPDVPLSLKLKAGINPVWKSGGSINYLNYIK